MSTLVNHQVRSSFSFFLILNLFGPRRLVTTNFKLMLHETIRNDDF